MNSKIYGEQLQKQKLSAVLCSRRRLTYYIELTKNPAEYCYIIYKIFIMKTDILTTVLEVCWQIWAWSCFAFGLSQLCKVILLQGVTVCDIDTEVCQQRLQDLKEKYGQGRIIFMQVDVRNYQQFEGDRNLLWRFAWQARIDIFVLYFKGKS
jgi:hypothetical protein